MLLLLLLLLSLLLLGSRITKCIHKQTRKDRRGWGGQVFVKWGEVWVLNLMSAPLSITFVKQSSNFFTPTVPRPVKRGGWCVPADLVDEKITEFTDQIRPKNPFVLERLCGYPASRVLWGDFALQNNRATAVVTVVEMPLETPSCT